MNENKNMRVYCAGPFFNSQQLETMVAIENVVDSFDETSIFRPRNGAASAKKLNKDIGAGKDPSAETRKQVFRDNVENIDDADLVVALIDDRDIGTIFEIGYAYAKGVPVMTFTDKGYGMNLMLAESVLAHCKGLGQLRHAMKMFVDGATEEQFESAFKRANLAEGKQADKDMDLYTKGE